VYVDKPYNVDRYVDTPVAVEKIVTVEKPFIQEKIVEKIVEKNIVQEKLVEKYVDRPVPVI